jgi:hypothetical protein
MRPTSRAEGCRATGDECLEAHGVRETVGLSASQVSSLRRVHGLNKLEPEAKDHICIRFSADNMGNVDPMPAR